MRGLKEQEIGTDAATKGAAGRYTPPSEWPLRSDAAFVHVCANETISGVEFHEVGTAARHDQRIRNQQRAGCNQPGLRQEQQCTRAD